jgi:hypothetical protein
MTERLEEATTPLWDDNSEVEWSSKLANNNKNESEPNKKNDTFSIMLDKVSGPVVVAVLLGVAAWMVNVDRSQQLTLYEMATQTKILDEMLAKLNEIPLLDKRISKLEDTRFTRERGEDLEKKVIIIQSDVSDLKKRK